MYVHDNQTKAGGFVMAADDGQAFWFLNTLTINKVRSDDSQGQLGSSSITGCLRASPRRPTFTWQATRHSWSWTASSTGSAETRRGGPGPARWCTCRTGSRMASPCPRQARAGSSWSCHQAGFDQFVAAAGEPGPRPAIAQPVAPDPARLTQLAAARGIQILPPPQG